MSPHLLLACLALVPVALLYRSRVLIGALLVAALVTIVLYGDEWISLPVTRPPAAESIDLMSWNLQLGARTPRQTVDTLLLHRADVVALQELTNDAAAAIEADPTLRAWYPYQALAPERGVFGLGILSAYPVSDQQLEEDDPVSLTARLTLPSGRQIQMFNAHPQPATIGILRFDATSRDEGLRIVRERFVPLLNGTVPLIVIGDFNVASSEPAYRKLAAGLRDVHRDVGFGPGWTWRPERLIRFGIGLIRIDYVLTSLDLESRATAVDCRQLGDHCILMATVDLPSSAGDGTAGVSSRAR